MVAVRAWFGVLVGLAVFGACSGFAPSASASGVVIRRIDTQDYPTIKVLVVAPRVTGTAPTLTENSARVTGFAAENLGDQQSVALVIDHSQSMHGRTLADAVRAAHDFVDAKPPSDQVAVIAVASAALTLADFAADPSTADAVLRGLAIDPQYGTVLWDGVSSAADALRKHGLPGRTIILVSDGQNEKSRVTLAQAIAAAQRAHAAVYTVGIPDITYAPRPLQQLAAATGGRFYPALSTAELPSIYAAIGAELRRSWLLSYATAARPGDTLRLDVGSSGAHATTTTTLAPRLGAKAQGSSSQVLTLVVLVLTASVLLAGAAIAIRNLGLPRWRPPADDF